MVSYTYGVWDILRSKNLNELDKLIQYTREESESDEELEFGIGIYDEKLCSELGIDKPLKSLKDRMKIMKEISGVDFVFPLTTLDRNVMQQVALEAYQEYKRETVESRPKEFKLGYAPGTYDLFHAGHLENLLIASEKCEKLIVGIKSDELVERHKNKKPFIKEQERMEILRHFKFVYDVYKYHTRDLKNAKIWIESKYDTPLDAVFLGSDLKNDFSDISDDIKIVYTPREKEKMEKRSTSYYGNKLIKLPDNLTTHPTSYVGNIKGKITKILSSQGHSDKKTTPAAQEGGQEI